MFPAPDDELGSAVVSYRPTAGQVASALFSDMPLAGLLSTAPWRTFIWCRGQKHYSGTYWSATEHGHVVYESLHELSCLLLADFDQSVERIVAQPFRLEFPTRPKPTWRVPDFLLSTDHGAVVVDVTWPERLKEPELATRLTLTRELLDRRGWIHAVVTDYPADFLANVRFLAGFRRDWLINQEALAVLRSQRESLVGMSLGEVTLNIHPLPAALIRSALFHLLWRGEVVVDLATRLNPSTRSGGWPRTATSSPGKRSTRFRGV
jgi:hypothetical protein